MDTVDAKWNDAGSILAIAGTQRASAQLDRDVNVVQFFSPFGEVKNFVLTKYMCYKLTKKLLRICLLNHNYNNNFIQTCLSNGTITL